MARTVPSPGISVSGLQLDRSAMKLSNFILHQNLKAGYFNSTNIISIDNSIDSVYNDFIKKIQFLFAQHTRSHMKNGIE